ncbi:hypothetical protein CTI12_AA294320 [Artemisia annua]|uniref:Uncharacterized protein n=1 Tax=Artemisia annua TaxID=35608 RepID=A0A2U1N886_ARTAN|nr:hypothetical protein CTI12_AA294320 [Artemisia annua]
MYMSRRLPESGTGVIDLDEVSNHIKGRGFVDNYYLWGFHGEEGPDTDVVVENDANMLYEFDELLQRMIYIEEDHARKMLALALEQESYEAEIEAMRKEIDEETRLRQAAGGDIQVEICNEDV